jgi:uncharacterized protein DUF3551
MKETMPLEPEMRMMVAAICGFLAIAIPQPASAGAWCAWYDVYTYNCGFYTLQQCQQTILGDFGAYCAPNQWEQQRTRVQHRLPKQ